MARAGLSRRSMMASERTGSGMTSNQCSTGSCVVRSRDFPKEGSSRSSRKSFDSSAVNFLSPESSRMMRSGLTVHFQSFRTCPFLNRPFSKQKIQVRKSRVNKRDSLYPLPHVHPRTRHRLSGASVPGRPLRRNVLRRCFDHRDLLPADLPFPTTETRTLPFLSERRQCRIGRVPAVPSLSSRIRSGQRFCRPYGTSRPIVRHGYPGRTGRIGVRGGACRPAGHFGPSSSTGVRPDVRRLSRALHPDRASTPLPSASHGKLPVHPRCGFGVRLRKRPPVQRDLPGILRDDSGRSP